MYWKFLLILFCLTFKVQARYNKSSLKFNHPRENQPVTSTPPYINNPCETQLNLFSEALESSELWAVRLMDTWAKIRAGYLSGNILNFGDFDSCVNFKHDLGANGVLKGQHCWVHVTALENSTLNKVTSDLSLKNLASFFRNFKIGTINAFCMPTVCSSEAVVDFLNYQFLLDNDLVALLGDCRDVNAVPFNGLFYLSVSIFSIIFIIIFLSTVYDIIKSRSENQQPNKLLASFSIYTNGSKLFDMTKIKSSSSLNCIHGLRGISILWIILGHRAVLQIFWENQNDFFIFLKDRKVLASIIIAHPLAVDTFFVMGALLMTWSTLRDCEKQQLNITRMIWRRYLRYTPALAFLILFVVGLSDHLLKGPIETKLLREPCIKSWWYALLHIQNYINTDDICINPSWYLSVDFQLFIISPFIIWPIHKYGKKSLTIPAILLLITICYIFSISIVYEIEFDSPLFSPEYWKFIYLPTYSRAGPWFVGIILGYFLYVHRGHIFKINMYLNAFMWIISFSILLAIILVQHPFFAGTEPIAQGFHVAYLTLHRNLWAIALCWIIFACQNLKTGGIVRWFLSLPHWQPISRMGLSMYLFGIVYQILMRFNQRNNLYINFWHFVPVFMSDVIIITIISSFAYMAFEAPPLIIEDFFYKKIKSCNK